MVKVHVCEKHMSEANVELEAMLMDQLDLFGTEVAHEAGDGGDGDGEA